MLDLGSSTEAEVRQALWAGFPKHPLHKIVCIGALVASRQPEGWRIDALGASHVGERTEGELISAFVERISQLRPQLITFNGHSFDLPVLRYRAMVNRVGLNGSARSADAKTPGAIPRGSVQSRLSLIVPRIILLIVLLAATAARVLLLLVRATPAATLLTTRLLGTLTTLLATLILFLILRH